MGRRRSRRKRKPVRRAVLYLLTSIFSIIFSFGTLRILEDFSGVSNLVWIGVTVSAVALFILIVTLKFTSAETIANGK